MVILGRHGTITLDNKPCRINKNEHVKAHNSSETSSIQNRSRGTSRLEQRTLGVDAPNHQQYTSCIPHINQINAINVFPVARDYDAALFHDVIDTNLSKPHTLDVPADPADSDCNVSASDTLHSYSDLISSFTHVSTPPSSKRSSVASNLTSYWSGLLPFSFIFGYKELRVVAIYLIFSMFLICKGCVCSVCSGNSSPRIELPWYLQLQVNESKVEYTSNPGTCLRLNGSDVVNTILCNMSMPTSNRMSIFNSTNTNFCGLPLHRVLSAKEQDIVRSCEEETCSRVLNEKFIADEDLSQYFSLFKDVLNRMDCREVYSVTGTCEKCEAAYKDWLCSIYVQQYFNGEPIKPCLDFCDRVSEHCPFFRPYGETQIGEPGFLCKDPNINPHNAAALYGPEGCCYRPEHLCDNSTTTCITLNVTSNCTQAGHAHSHASRNHPTRPLLLQLCIYVFIYVLWVSQALSQYSCIGLT